MEIARFTSFPVFDKLIEKFRTEPIQYESKIAILANLTSVMSNDHVERLFKYVKEVLGEPAENSIFKKNVNPLRTGLMLYKLIKDLQIQFNYSEYTAQQILAEIDQ